jgi:hypothetical protein
MSVTREWVSSTQGEQFVEKNASPVVDPLPDTVGEREQKRHWSHKMRADGGCQEASFV